MSNSKKTISKKETFGAVAQIKKPIKDSEDKAPITKDNKSSENSENKKDDRS